MSSFGTIDVYKGRTIDYQFTLYEADGTTGITLAASDVVRFKLGVKGAAPDLDLDSAAASANGSSVTVDDVGPPALATVRFAQDDTASLAAKTYDAEIGLVDDSETTPTDAFKPIAEGKVRVIATMTGDTGKS